MARFGGYETDRQIHRSGLATIYTARPVGAPADQLAEHVVKFVRPVVSLGDEAAPPEIELFLDAVHVQRQVLEAGGQHWAPIHESGTAEGGAFYVSRYYQRSLSQLIRGRVHLTSASLFVIADCVVRGLVELRDACARPHGDLRPSNVLVEGAGAAGTEVVLSDPLPTSQLAADSAAADIRAIAELIYQLIVHKPYQRMGGWPVPRSQEWRRLGGRGKAWLELVNELLDPSASPERLTLDYVVERVARLRPRKLGAAPIAVGFAALLAVGIGVGVWLALRPKDTGREEVRRWDAAAEQRWAALCNEYYQWFAAFRGSATAEHEQRWAADDTLGGLFEKLHAADSNNALNPRDIAGEPGGDYREMAEEPPEAAQRPDAILRTEAALTLVESVGTTLTPDRWPVLGALEQGATEWKQRGWARPAACLAAIVAAVKPSPRLGEAVDRALAAHKTLLPKVGELWNKLQQHRAVVEGTDDKVLQAFGTYVDAETRAEGDGGSEEDIEALVAKLTAVQATAARLATFVQGPWKSQVDQALFAKESALLATFDGTVTKHTVRLWLDEVQQYYKLPPDKDPRGKRQAWDQMLTAIEGDLATLARIDAEARSDADRLRSRLDQKLRAALDDLWTRPAVRKVESGLRQAARETRDQVVRLHEEVRSRLAYHIGKRGDPVEWYQAVMSLEFQASKAVSETWKARRRQLLGDVEPAQLRGRPADYLSLRKKVDALKNALSQLETDPGLPRGLPDRAKAFAGRRWHGAFAALLDRRREATLERGLAQLPWDQGVPRIDDDQFQEQWAELGSAYRGVRDRLAEAMASVGTLETSLDACYLLDETPPGAEKAVAALFDDLKQHPLLQDPALTDALKPVASRVADLRSVASLADRRALVRTALSAPHREVVLAAWRQLDTLRDPVWPSSEQEVRQNAEVKVRLTSEIRVLRDPARRQSLQERIVQEDRARQRRWLALQIDRRQRELAALAQVVEGSGDPVLAQFTKSQQKELAAIGQDDVAARLANLGELMQLATRLRAFVEGDWKRVDQPVFKKDLLEQKAGVPLPPDGVPSRETFATWLDKVKGYYRLDPRDDPRGERKAWDDHLDQAGKNLIEARRFGAEAAEAAAALEKRLRDEVKPQVDALLDLPAIEKNKEALAEQAPKVRQLLSTLVEEIGGLIEKPADFVQRINGITTVAQSQALNARWVQQRRKAVDTYSLQLLQADSTLYFNVRTKFDELKAFLGGLDDEQAFPRDLPPSIREAFPADVQAAFQQLLDRTREETLTALVEKVPWAGDGFPGKPLAEFKGSADWQAVQKGYADFRQGMGDVVARVRRIAELLDAGYLLDAKPDDAPKTPRQLYDDWLQVRDNFPAAVRDPLRPIEQRMDALLALEGLDRDGLVARARGLDAQDSPQAHFIVWRRLGGIADWPQDLDELKLDLGLARTVRLLADRLGRRDPHPVRWVDEAMPKERPRRFEACVGRLVGGQEVKDDAIGQVLRLSKDFGLEVGKLSPTTQFRFQLHQFRQNVFGLADNTPKEDLKAALGAFRDRVAGVPLDQGERSRVDEFIKKLDGVLAQDDAAGAGGGLEKAGPATFPGGGWTATPAADGEAVTYRWGARHSLEFVLVDATGGRGKPAYLCTTEMSVGLLIDVVQAAGRWNHVMGLLKDYDPFFDPRKGPRSWELGRGRKSIRAAGDWLVALPGVQYYPGGLNAGRPSGAHPMQYVSPEAAMYVARLLGCRLPTAAEWAAAARAHEQGRPRNLRDAAWRQQQAHIADLKRQRVRADWPDAGIFLPRGTQAQTEERATVALEASDDVLWFAPVGAGSGVHHLVGNVAEFVFDAAAQFEEAFNEFDALTPEALTRLTTDAAAALKVVGGSALSPPELWDGRDRPFAQAYGVAVADARDGFSDVGFRVAFTAPRVSLVARLKRALEQEGYLAGAG